MIFHAEHDGTRHFGMFPTFPNIYSDNPIDHIKLVHYLDGP